MYLKALEVQGFKSFPDKTRLTFSHDITAVVGPNGSGKSNIADALLWVMGEQRARTLRGGKMEDVIFGGTEKRGKLGFAQVSLVLDNSTGVLDVDSAEVTLTRRYYRSGESEYYINRHAVRLRDVTELLMDTGLGRDGYSVIGQGRISEIVSARSTDRREIFEEAAGIARYRFRREEAERKLAKTDENLLRVNDKISELELQLGPLKKQAETAEKYLALRGELRAAEVSVWAASLARLRDQLETAARDCAAADAALEQTRQAQERLYAQAEAVAERMRQKDVETDAARERQRTYEARAADCRERAAVLRANAQSNAGHIGRIRADLAGQQERDSALTAQINQRRARVQELEKARADAEDALRALLQAAADNETACGGARQQLQALTAQEADAAERLARGRAVLSMLEEAAQTLSSRDGELAAAAEQTQRELETLQRQQKDADAALREADGQLTALGNRLAGHRMRLQQREQRVQELSGQKNSLSVELGAADGRIRMLSDLEREYEGFGRAVKTVMREAQRGTLRGVHGPAGSLIHAPDRCALAIETAMGAAMQNIVTETQQNAKAAMEYLKTRDAGRCTFLPMNVIRGGTLRDVPAGAPGFVGVASELVAFDGRYREIVEYLLGRTVVAETLADAIAMANASGNRLRIVTLDGQMLNPGGSMTGGSAAKNTGVLSRANELARLRAGRGELAARLEACAASLSTAERELAAARAGMEDMQARQEQAGEARRAAQSECDRVRLLYQTRSESLEAMQAERAAGAGRLTENAALTAQGHADCETAEQELAGLRAEIGRLTEGDRAFEARRRSLGEQAAQLRARSASYLAERDAAVQAAAELEQLRGSLQGDRSAAEAKIAELEAENAAIRQQLEATGAELAEFAAVVAAAQEELSLLTAQKLELEGERTRTEKAGQEKNRELLEAQRLCARLEQKKLSAELEEKQLLDKLWDSYSLSRTAALAEAQPVESMAEANRRAAGLRQKIAALGTPNLGAIDEFARVSERFDYLAGQRDDVQKASDELKGIIADITREMRGVFLEQFAAIDACFRKTFLELFGGGRAALQLEDENDPLECGIEIRVQPPGKALSSISLLSGGEKAFVAIALYFAIMKVRPTLFCVMDEIEAALDDANVVRYASYMRSMTEHTQFIVITHRRGTMEEADFIYGVTMQEKGVSRVLELDLNEAERTLK